MALVTVVRNLVGITLELPDGVKVRPWHYVELTEISSNMRARLLELRSFKSIQLDQVSDGQPMPLVKL
jgi:hypothetical protein